MGESLFTGKRVADALYVHVSAVGALLDLNQVEKVRSLLEQVQPLNVGTPNIIKVHTRDNRISLLSYPDFDEDPFPRLAASWTEGAERTLRFRTYAESLNPPILHRKELLVPEGWPRRSEWLETTILAESLGLFDETHTIGFLDNWRRLLDAKGYEVVEGHLVPVGNTRQRDPQALEAVDALDTTVVQRHLTALSRPCLSAPVQLLLRTGLLAPGTTLFDYGCGKGDDLRGLQSAGFEATGWDPYYAADWPRSKADIVNLGFVINVIEDPVERAEALRCAAALARRALIVSVMLQNASNGGVAFSDGVLSSRNTFQKYFSQEEFRDYLEHALELPVSMAAPGIALVFKDRELEQSFLIKRFRKRDVATRLLSSAAVARRTKPPRPQRERHPTVAQERREELRPLLSGLWELALDLGRWPVAEEVPNLQTIESKGISLTRALRLVQRTSDHRVLHAASQARRDDVLLFLAMQQFSRRPAYKRLDERLQRDIRAFFGAYGAAYSAAASLLRQTGEPSKLLEACQEASSRGVGHLEADHSLQLHVSMVERLPVILRAYVGCGLILWDETSAVQLVKIHITSGKLTLLEFDDFDGQLLPRLQRRIKINLRRLDYSIFDYGSATTPRPLLYRKSRFINEEYPGFEKHVSFDEALLATGMLEEDDEYGPSEEDLLAALELRRIRVTPEGFESSDRIPPLDQACGRHFSYRSFVECGETQRRLGIPNIPLRSQTYNALYALAIQILDPLIDYFGGIRLTYGFSCPGLAAKIDRRIAPKLDQHSSCELGRSGALVCSRGGAACDFLVEDESMREVADWIIENLPFDRLYYYGHDRPLHVSYGPQGCREAYEMRPTASGALVPRLYPK
ncbi:DNA phosphorothioation-associated putative methyltransferase [Ramlibacter sp. MMS24-I3-19]|uniref:DNA phosphorothioation-associated putative methyltransferase n=1 Tax=Ramlibacter sp. MMS24-I3-19 TaxID=3416606 RepID=UPI003D035859